MKASQFLLSDFALVLAATAVQAVIYLILIASY
jgi:hypothetical protein